jgi:hypothetical protein
MPSHVSLTVRCIYSNPSSAFPVRSLIWSGSCGPGRRKKLTAKAKVTHVFDSRKICWCKYSRHYSSGCILYRVHSHGILYFLSIDCMAQLQLTKNFSFSWIVQCLEYSTQLNSLFFFQINSPCRKVHRQISGSCRNPLLWWHYMNNATATTIPTVEADVHLRRGMPLLHRQG